MAGIKPPNQVKVESDARRVAQRGSVYRDRRARGKPDTTEAEARLMEGNA